MGLKNGSKAFWTAKNLLYQDLVVIHQQIFKKSLPIRVDVDISVIFHSVLRDQKYGYSESKQKFSNTPLHILALNPNVTKECLELVIDVYPCALSSNYTTLFW